MDFTAASDIRMGSVYTATRRKIDLGSQLWLGLYSCGTMFAAVACYIAPACVRVQACGTLFALLSLSRMS